MSSWYEIERLQQDGEQRYASIVEGRAVDRAHGQAAPGRLARGKIELGKQLERWGQALQQSGQAENQRSSYSCC